MSQSSLVTKKWWANESNFTYGRTDTIHGIVVHHAASTNLDSVGQAFATYGRGGSAHYGVKGKQIHQYVAEEYTAWHCGDWAGNSCTVGIETVNSTGAPNWLVDEETFDTLVKLVADIAKRNNLGKIKFDPNGTYPTLSAHRDWSATYCPGDYLYGRMNELADKVNAINFPPAKAELKWSKLSKKTTYITVRDTHLYDFNHTHAENIKAIKEYSKGDVIEIYGKCENKTVGKTYMVTEYSYTNKATNGFKPDALEEKPQEEPKPKPQPVPEPEPVTPAPKPDGSGKEENPRGLSDEEYAKVLEEMKAKGQLIIKNAKENNAMIPMSNKVYDILKIVAIVILPLANALYVGLSKVWGFGFGTEIDQTIQLVIAALNTLLGAALVKSSSDYKKEQ